jgi:hypothetical protein
MYVIQDLKGYSMGFLFSLSVGGYELDRSRELVFE